MRLQFIVALIFVCGCPVSTVYAQQTAKVTPSSIAYLEYLPQDYNNNSESYPLVIFLHGIGERGVSSTDPEALKASAQTVANVGLAQYIKYGTNYPFIVVSPQLKNSYGTWPANYVMDVLNYVKTYLRVDEKRIYITGLSLGGFGTWTTLAAYPEVFAAAVPICSGGNAVNQACAIASQNLPLWAFHGTGDNIVWYGITTDMVNAVNVCTPHPSPLAKMTLFSGLSHYIWDKVYLETDAINWMLSYRKGSSGGGTVSNNPPTVDSGKDQATNATSITLTGGGSDTDGWVDSYKWTQYGGAAATLTNANTYRVTISGLKNGTYYFRLTATDNEGATASDDVVVTVSGQATTPPPGNAAPVADAGRDQATSATSITLTGGGSDTDGWVDSYKWTQYGGAAATLTNANTYRVTISGLKNGTYYFRLTATDNEGATTSDDVVVTVSGQATTPPPGNAAPIADAGRDQTTSATSITLTGNGSDTDGWVDSYKWTQYGGAPATLTNANTYRVIISGLKNGTYYFRLTATDNEGATTSDDVVVTITGQSNPPS